MGENDILLDIDEVGDLRHYPDMPKEKKRAFAFAQASETKHGVFSAFQRKTVFKDTNLDNFQNWEIKHDLKRAARELGNGLYHVYFKNIQSAAYDLVRAVDQTLWSLTEIHQMGGGKPKRSRNKESKRIRKIRKKRNIAYLNDFLCLSTHPVQQNRPSI